MPTNIGVVGDQGSVLPFKLFGFDVRIATEALAIKQALETMAQAQYSVIYITEPCAALVPATLARYEQQLCPAIVLLPNHEGTLGIGLANVEKNVERAVGQNIL